MKASLWTSTRLATTAALLATRRGAAALLALAATGLLLLQAFGVGAYWGAPLGEHPAWIGTGPTVRDRLPARAPGEPYTFAILGDAQENPTAETLIRKLRGHRPDFLVLLGDVVRTGREGNHRSWAERLEAMGDPGFPLVWVMGNRDVKRAVDDDEPSSLTIPEFEALYGPRRFWFSHGGDLFVAPGIADPLWDTAAARAYLDRTLAAQRARHRRVFVLTHGAARVHPALEDHSLWPGPTRALLEVLARHRVDYVLSAHYHGRVRAEVGGTVHLVSGGGGGGLHGEPPTIGHHAVLLHAGAEGVREEVLETAEVWDLAHLLEGVAIAGVAPWVLENPWQAMALDLVLLGVVLLYGRRVLRRAPPAR